MRWKDQDQSDNVEDRRGMPVSRGRDTFRAPTL